MLVLKFAGRSATLGMFVVIASTTACLAEPIDESSPEIASPAVQELSLGNTNHVGPLVLQDTPQGAKKYDKLAKRWLEWAMAQPWSTGPVNNPTGDQCDAGQKGDVWLLAGTSGGPVTRSCTIPEDKALYFPLLNHWIIPPEEFVDTPEEFAEFIAFAEFYFPLKREVTCSLTLRLDGQDILPDMAALDEALWVDIYDPFKVDLDADNFGDFPAGKNDNAVTAGRYALLLPLEPGDHTLEFGGALCGDDDELTFETSAVYNLHVED